MLFSRREEEQPQRVAGMTDKLGREVQRETGYMLLSRTELRRRLDLVGSAGDRQAGGKEEDEGAKRRRSVRRKISKHMTV